MDIKKLLLVDDEAIILMALKMEIKKRYRHCKIETALNAEEGLQMLQKHETGVNVVISDYQMPGMKGDAFLQKIEQDFPETVRILITGQAPNERITQLSENATIRTCLSKPWNKQQLYQILDPMLQEE